MLQSLSIFLESKVNKKDCCWQWREWRALVTVVILRARARHASRTHSIPLRHFSSLSQLVFSPLRPLMVFSFVIMSIACCWIREKSWPLEKLKATERCSICNLPPTFNWGIKWNLEKSQENHRDVQSEILLWIFRSKRWSIRASRRSTAFAYGYKVDFYAKIHWYSNHLVVDIFHINIFPYLLPATWNRMNISASPHAPHWHHLSHFSSQSSALRSFRRLSRVKLYFFILSKLSLNLNRIRYAM